MLPVKSQDNLVIYINDIAFFAEVLSSGAGCVAGLFAEGRSLTEWQGLFIITPTGLQNKLIRKLLTDRYLLFGCVVQ